MTFSDRFRRYKILLKTVALSFPFFLALWKNQIDEFAAHVMLAAETSSNQHNLSCLIDSLNSVNISFLTYFHQISFLTPIGNADQQISGYQLVHPAPLFYTGLISFHCQDAPFFTVKQYLTVLSEICYWVSPPRDSSSNIHCIFLHCSALTHEQWFKITDL